MVQRNVKIFIVVFFLIAIVLLFMGKSLEQIVKDHSVSSKIEVPAPAKVPDVPKALPDKSKKA